MDDLPRLRAGMLAVFQDVHAIDEYIAHARRILMRLLECRVVLNGGGIEDHDIGEVARPERAAAVELKVLRGQRSQPPYGPLEGNEPFIADILAQQPGDVAKGARIVFSGGLIWTY